MNSPPLRRRGAALYPVECLVLIFFVLAAGLYQYLGLSFRDPIRLYVAKVTLGIASYFIGLTLGLFIVRLRDIQEALARSEQKSFGATVCEYRGVHFARGRLIQDLRLIHAISAMFVIYINLKHLIPYVNNRVYDAALMDYEQRIFAGLSPAEWMLQIIGARWAPLLSEAYTAFYPYVALLTVCLVLQRHSAKAQSFCFAFCLLWFLAVFVEYAVPTLGPCFSYPHLFTELPPTRVTELQHELWVQKLYLDRFPMSDKGVWLISGLPSLHIAAIVLGSIYLQSVQPLLGLCSWLFFAVTCVTTIYFGWHFLVDLPAAVLLVLFVLCVTKCGFGSLPSLTKAVSE